MPSSNSNSRTILQNKPVVHVSKDLLPSWLPAERTRIILQQEGETEAADAVCYWMQRDVRVADNWALSWAAYLAQTWNAPLHVVYALAPPPPPPPPSLAPTDHDRAQLPPDLLHHLPMTERYGKFLLGGLELAHCQLNKLGIPLHVVQPQSHSVVGETVCNSIIKTLMMNDNNKEEEAMNDKKKQKDSPKKKVVVVTDFSPLRQAREWIEVQAASHVLFHKVGSNNTQDAFISTSIIISALYQVDAHNIVPVWIAADKRQVGARTLRPKIHKVIHDYLPIDFPKLETLLNNKQQQPKQLLVVLPPFDRDSHERFLKLDPSVPPSVDEWAMPGTDAGWKQFESFCQHGLPKYEQLRNDPTQSNICSDMSPWINHGHVSFQRMARYLQTSSIKNKHASAKAVYLEEGIIRRELSDNYLYYTPNDYDQLSGAAEWAQETLRVHASDVREYLYSTSELEEAQTHDDLWNAAQLQVIQEGRMHGFLRMYWCKKILEWTESPQVALRTAQYLNDKYALDGRDPNGFVGVGWSIMGIHDRAWAERPVFGKIRFMNYNGCKRKLNVPLFVSRYKGAAENAAKYASAASSQMKKGEKRQQQQTTLDSFTSSNKNSQKTKKMMKKKA